MTGSPRFLLSGYYGFGNLGDEALLGVIVAQLRARLPGCAIDVLSADPAATAATYGVEATPRMDARLVRAAIARADAVLSGGGGLLQNATSTRSLVYYCEILRRAVRAKKPAMIFAQSIGPLDLRGRAIVRWWCGGVSAATVRDERSFALLRRLLPRVPVERAADPVFLVDAPAEPYDFGAQGLDPGAPYVIVSVRRSPGFENGIATLAAAVDRLAGEYGALVAFLPLGGAADAEASTQVIRRCRTAPTLLPSCTPAEAAQVIGAARAVIGMRLHAVIFAARFGVPFLAIPYDPKVSSLTADLRYPLAPLFEPKTARRDAAEPQTAALVDRLWNEHDALAALLREGAAEQRILARRSFDAAESLLARP